MRSARRMFLKVNGKERSFEEGDLSILKLIDILEVKGPMVAVELNGRVVKKESYALELLKEGDVVEILELVGGG